MAINKLHLRISISLVANYLEVNPRRILLQIHLLLSKLEPKNFFESKADHRNYLAVPHLLCRQFVVYVWKFKNFCFGFPQTCRYLLAEFYF